MKKKARLCAVCGGLLTRKAIRYDQHWGDQIVIFDDVPASVCATCGEIWLGSKTVQAMEKILLQQKKPTKKIAIPVWSLSGLKAA
jgi:YgiT-type zinc finger domain-containing protein